MTQSMADGGYVQDAPPLAPATSSTAKGDEDVIASMNAGFARQTTPYVAAGERLTRIWYGGWSAASLNRVEVSQDTDEGMSEEQETIDYLEGEGPLFGELYPIEVNHIGTGSFGMCFPAVHLSRPCCVKIVDKELAGEEYRRCLVDNGMYSVLLRKSEHPNIVSHYDFLECPLYYYVVMERLEGPDLFDQFMEDYPVTEKYVQNIMKQVLAALRQLKIEGIVHRDVKLENFRYASKNIDCNLKLLDFGFARRIDAEWESKLSGTLMYLAPELVADTPSTDRAGFGAAADVWAGGVVFCMLLSGKEPFGDRDVWNLGRAHGQSIRDDLLASRRLSQASLQAKDLLGELLTIDPHERISAGGALDHCWFGAASSSPVNVTREAYIQAKHSSRLSQKFINEPVTTARTMSRNRLRSNSEAAGGAIKQSASSQSLDADDDELFCYD